MRQRPTGTSAGAGLLLVVALCGAALVGAAQPAWSAPVLVDFDDLADVRGPGSPATEVTDQYVDDGVRFNGPAALDYAQAVPEPMPGFPHSGTVAVEPCYSQEFCRAPLQMTFTRPQQRVRVHVGYDGELDQTVAVRLVAFGADGGVIDRVALSLGPSEAPIPIDNPLEVTGPGAQIASAEVSLDAFDSGLAIDSIEFERPAPALQLSPGALDFGEVELGQRAAQELTIRSAGGADLDVRDISVPGAAAESFAIVDDGCTSQPQPPGETCGVTVALEPGSAGGLSATLIVTADDPDSPHEVGLSGVGIPAGGGDDGPGGDGPGGDGDEDAPGTDEGLQISDLDDLGGVLLAAAALAVALAGLTIARLLRRRRSRWVRTHVRVRPGRQPSVDTVIEDIGPDSSHALRIEPQPDRGTQTLEVIS